MSVTRINDEWIPEFVGREGPVSTQGVAYRFGVRLELARQTLNNYRSAGYMESERGSTATGRMNFWSLTDAGKALLEKRKKLRAKRHDLAAQVKALGADSLLPDWKP